MLSAPGPGQVALSPASLANIFSGSLLHAFASLRSSAGRRASCRSDALPPGHGPPRRQAPQQAGAALRGPLAGGGRSKAGGRVPLPPAAQMAGRLRPRPEPHADREKPRKRGEGTNAVEERHATPSPHAMGNRGRRPRSPQGQRVGVRGNGIRRSGITPGGGSRRTIPHGCGQRRSLVRQGLQAGCSRKDCGQGR